MKSRRKQSILSLLLGCILTGCATPIVPSHTPTAATATLAVFTQTLTATPASGPSIKINMFDENNGWGLTGDTNTRSILRTKDGGLTWKDITPVGSGPINDHSPFFMDAQHAWVISNALDQEKISIYKTGDAGENWIQYQNLPFKTLDSFSFTDPNYGWGMADLDGGAGNLYFKLYQTSDGGKSWQNLKLDDPRTGSPEKGLPAGTFHTAQGQGFDFRSPNVIWFGGNVMLAEKSITLLVSHNAGQSWDKRQIDIPNSEKIKEIVFYRLPTFITEKDGYILATYTLPDDQGITRNTASVILTHDAGKTWTVSPALLYGTRELFDLQFISAKDAFVRCGKNLCATHDGAQTWQRIKSNIIFGVTSKDKNAVFLLDFDFVNTTTGWASVEKDDMKELLKTTDGGQTWIKLSPSIVP